MLIGNFSWLFNTIGVSLEAAREAFGSDQKPLSEIIFLGNKLQPICDLLRTAETSSQRLN
jgi:hypothetical protein